MDTHHHHSHELNSLGPRNEETVATCPATGDDVNKQEAQAAGHVREYAGETYYLCCATCVRLFENDPQKYASSSREVSGLRLLQKTNLLGNVWSFSFMPTVPLTWKAGQFIRVELPHTAPDSEGTKRWFTISSAPYEGTVTITTRITPSTFKQALASLAIDERIPLLERPAGEFIWQNSKRPVVFIAGGIGITPYHSILKQRNQEGLPLSVTLLYANRTDDVLYKSEFDALAGADPSFQPLYVSGEPLTTEKAIDMIPVLLESFVYLSGPEQMVEGIARGLLAAGLSKDQLMQDFFPRYTDENY